MANDIKQQPMPQQNDFKQPMPQQKKLPQRFITRHAINGLTGRAFEDRVLPKGSKVSLEQLGEQNARVMLSTGAIEAAED